MLTDKENVKWLRELADAIDNPVDPKSTEPEWTLIKADDGFARVQFQGVNRTYGTPMSIAVTMVNAGNSYGAMKALCTYIDGYRDRKSVAADGPVIPDWIVETASKALSLAVYDDDGRRKDG